MIPTVVVASIAAHGVASRVVDIVSRMLIVLSAAPASALVARLVRLLHDGRCWLGDVARADGLVALNARSGKSLVLSHGEIGVEVGFAAGLGAGVGVVVGVLRPERVGGGRGIRGARVDPGGILGEIRTRVVGRTAAGVVVSRGGA